MQRIESQIEGMGEDDCGDRSCWTNDSKTSDMTTHVSLREPVGPVACTYQHQSSELTPTTSSLSTIRVDEEKFYILFHRSWGDVLIPPLPGQLWLAAETSATKCDGLVALTPVNWNSCLHRVQAIESGPVA
nr:hypothetical protein CFP56_30796 [Quercus suber]